MDLERQPIRGNYRAAILALGSVNADLQVRVERWPAPGETLIARDYVMLGGGKSANIAFFARRVGVPAALIARVGDDFLADRALESLVHAQVDLAATHRGANCPTGVAMISVRADGDKTILLAPNANARWHKEDVQEVVRTVQSAPSGSVLATNLEIPPFVVEAAVGVARQRGIPVVLDPSPAERMNDSLYRLADALTPNRSEAEQLSGHKVSSQEDAAQVAELLQRRSGGAVLLKLRGDCMLAHARGREVLRAPPVEAVDTTGAGDAFAAAVAIGLLEQRTLRECALLGMAATSLAVRTYGSQPAYPERAQLDVTFRALAAANAAS